MSVRLSINVVDVDEQLAAGFDFIRVLRSSTGPSGQFTEITAAAAEAATLTGTVTGPFAVAGQYVTVRINRGSPQSVELVGSDPMTATVVSEVLTANSDGLVAQDDGFGRVKISTDGTGTEQVLELLGDTAPLLAMGFEVGQIDTGESGRIPLQACRTQYLFVDESGTADDYYQVDFFNSTTSATSQQSPAVRGETVELKAKGQAESRAPRGLTLVRKTSHIFRNAFFADDELTVPLVPLDASRYPSFQIVDINGQIVSSGLATLDGQPGHYRVEFFVPADAILSNDDRRWRLEWLFIDETNRQFEKTTEFDVRDVEVTATPVRDIKMLAMCGQPFRVFIRELRRPFSITLNVTDASGTVPVAENVVFPATGQALGCGGSGIEQVLTEVIDGETYVYYYDIPADTLSAGITYQAIFQIRDTVGSVAEHAFQIIEVPPISVLQYFASMRMVIDKYQKRRQLIQAYQDSDLFEYLRRGLELVNSWNPITSFQMTSLPSQLTPYWLMAGQLWGLNAQFLLETDLSFDFCLDKDSVVRTDRGLVKLCDLGGVNARALAAARLVAPVTLSLVAAMAVHMRGKHRAQTLVDGMGLEVTAQSLGLSRVGLSFARETDHAGGWLWDTSLFAERLGQLTEAIPSSFSTSFALRSGDRDRKVQCVYDLGRKACYKVASELGYEVVGTAAHRFLTLDTETLAVQWRRLQDLRVGDVIAIDKTRDNDDNWDVLFEDVSDVNTTPATKQIYRMPKKLTPELARVLGYLVAEGACTTYNTVSFGVMDDALIDQFCSDFEAAFGAPPTDRGYGKQSPDQYAYDPTREHTDVRYVIGRGVELRRFLASIGLGYEKSRRKSIPWCILQAPLPLAAEFLKAYFDGDGCFSPDQVCFSSFSPTLRSQLQALLLRFGIVSRNAGINVTVRQPSLDIYATSVGFLHKGGEVTDLVNSSIRESLPEVLTKRLRSITALFGLNQGWARNRDDAYEIDPEVAARVERLVEMPVLWQTVTMIEPVGVRHVMDPSLYGGPDLLDHSFTAGGFVTHNSGQTTTLNYDHTGNIDTAISRAVDFIREGLGPAKTAVYRRQAGVGTVAGRPTRISGLHNYVYPIARIGSQDIVQLYSQMGLL